MKKFKRILGDPQRQEMTRIVQADDEEFIIAYCVREWSNKDQQKEDDATSRLLTAAPELLEVCEAALQDQLTLANGIRNEAICEALESAIAKAKGE